MDANKQKITVNFGGEYLDIDYYHYGESESCPEHIEIESVMYNHTELICIVNSIPGLRNEIVKSIFKQEEIDKKNNFSVYDELMSLFHQIYEG